MNKLFTGLIALIALAVVFFISVRVFNILDTARGSDRREQGAVLEARAVETDKELAAYEERAEVASVRLAALRTDIVRLEEERDAATQSTREALALRERAYVAVDVDTLPEPVRELVRVERGVAESFRAELLVERQINFRLDSAFTIAQDVQRESQRLLFLITIERDSALTLIQQWERSTQFSLGRLLFRDIPRKVACAGGGAAVAALNEGDVLLGAGIGLAACLIMEAIL